MKTNKLFFTLSLLFSCIFVNAQIDTILYQDFENVGANKIYNTNGYSAVNGLNNSRIFIQNGEVNFLNGNTTSGTHSFTVQKLNLNTNHTVGFFSDSIKMKKYSLYNKIEIKYNYIHPGVGLLLDRFVIFAEDPSATGSRRIFIHSKDTADTGPQFQRVCIDLDSFLNVNQYPFTNSSFLLIGESSVSSFPFTSGFTVDDVLITASLNEATHYPVSVISDTVSCNYTNQQTISLMARSYNTSPFLDSVQLTSIVKDEFGTILQIDSNISFVNALEFENYTIRSGPLQLANQGIYNVEFIIEAKNDTFPNDDTLRQRIINSSILPTFNEDFESYSFTGSNDTLPNISYSWLANGNVVQQSRQRIGKGRQSTAFGPSKDNTLGNNNGKYAYITTNAQNLNQVSLKMACFNNQVNTNKLVKLSYYYHAYEQDNVSLSLNVFLEDSLNQRRLIQHKDGDSIIQLFPSVNSNWLKDSVYFSASGFTNIVFQGIAKASGRNDAFFLDDIKIEYVDSSDFFLRHISPTSASFVCPDSALYEFDIVNSSSDTVNLASNSYQINSYLTLNMQVIDSFITIIDQTNYPNLWLPNSALRVQYMADLSVGGNYQFLSYINSNSDFLASDDTIATAYQNIVNPGVAFEVPTLCPLDSESVVLVGSNSSPTWQVFDSLNMVWNDFNTNQTFYRNQLVKPTLIRAKVCNVYSNSVNIVPKLSNLFASDTASISVNDTILFNSNFSHTNIIWNDTLVQQTYTFRGSVFNPGDTVILKQSAIDTSGCLLTDSIRIFIDFSNDIVNDQEINTIEISPNPSDGNFKIKLENKKDYDLLILNVKGQLVYKQNVNSKTTRVNLQVKPGYYTLKLVSLDKIINKKLIIQ